MFVIHLIVIFNLIITKVHLEYKNSELTRVHLLLMIGLKLLKKVKIELALPPHKTPTAIYGRNPKCSN